MNPLEHRANSRVSLPPHTQLTLLQQHRHLPQQLGRSNLPQPPTPTQRMTPPHTRATAAPPRRLLLHHAPQQLQRERLLSLAQAFSY